MNNMSSPFSVFILYIIINALGVLDLILNKSFIGCILIFIMYIFILRINDALLEIEELMKNKR